MSLHFYLNDGDRVMLVDGAEIHMDHPRALVIDRCSRKDVRGLGGGIYDMIVFPWMPAPAIFRKAIEKVYWGGYIVIYGPESVIEDVGYQVVKGNPGPVVFRRPPPPDDWTKEYYLEFQLPGKYWNAETKEMYPAYREKFAQIDVDWEGKTVIEYGCGRGEITRLIALVARKVWAIDNSVEAVRLTTEFCDDLPNVVVVHSDALAYVDILDTNWDGSIDGPTVEFVRVDVIVALDFVEHLPEDKLPRLFEQMHKNLRPGGMVHIVTPLGRDHVRDHKWHPTPKKLRKFMEDAGFTYKRHVVPEGSRKFYAEFIK